MVWDSDINLLQSQCYVLFTLLIRLSCHTTTATKPGINSVWSDLRPIFSVQWTFLSNNDSDWYHHWCRFCNGHSATCLVRIQNYRERGPPFSSSSQRHSSACGRSFCRCILFVRLPLKLPLSLRPKTVTFLLFHCRSVINAAIHLLEICFFRLPMRPRFCWTYLSFYTGLQCKDIISQILKYCVHCSTVNIDCHSNLLTY